MTPERLKKIDLCKYSDNKLILEQSNSNIHRLFANIGENLLSKNEELDDCFQLGWNSVAKFEMSRSGFKLTDIAVLQGNGKKEPEQLTGELLSNFRNKTYRQVVTRAVYTCTFAYLKSDDTIVLAHLDYAYQFDGLNKILEFLNPDANLHVTGICSRAWDDVGKSGRQEFSDGLTRAYGNNVKIVVRHKLDIKEPIPFYGHFEIGVYIKDDFSTELFGDFTFAPYSKEHSAPVECFDTIKDMLDYAQKNMKVLSNGGGGGCAVV